MRPSRESGRTLPIKKLLASLSTGGRTQDGAPSMQSEKHLLGPDHRLPVSLRRLETQGLTWASFGSRILYLVNHLTRLERLSGFRQKAQSKCPGSAQQGTKGGPRVLMPRFSGATTGIVHVVPKKFSRGLGVSPTRLFQCPPRSLFGGIFLKILLFPTPVHLPW